MPAKKVSSFKWLPWLQTNRKDSGYEMFALLLETNCIRQPKGQLPTSSYNHNTVHKICAPLTWLQVPYTANLKFICNDSFTDVLRVVSVL